MLPYGNNRHLKPHRQGDTHGVQHGLAVKGEVLAGKVELVEMPVDMPQAEQTGYQLRGDSRPGGALHAHAHIQNEGVVQNDVDETGDHQKNQRGTAIAQCAGDI